GAGLRDRGPRRSADRRLLPPRHAQPGRRGRADEVGAHGRVLAGRRHRRVVARGGPARAAVLSGLPLSPEATGRETASGESPYNPLRFRVFSPRETFHTRPLSPKRARGKDRMKDLSQLLTPLAFPAALERVRRSFARQPDRQTCGASAIRHGLLFGGLTIPTA